MPSRGWAAEYRFESVKKQSKRFATRRLADKDAARLFGMSGVSQVAVVLLDVLQ